MRTPGKFTISKGERPSGRPFWLVAGTLPPTEPGGKPKRVRREFGSEREAVSQQQTWHLAALNASAPTHTRQTFFTEAELREAEQAHRELAGRATILEAVRYYLDNYRQPYEHITVRAAVDEFLTAKKQAGRRGRTLDDLRSRLKPLVERHGDKQLADIGAPLLREIVFAPKDERTQLNRLVKIGQLFAWAKRHRYVAENPVELIDRPRPEEKAVKIITVDQARALMAAAATFKGGRWVPYIALSLFCGLRPQSEVERITWGEIDTGAGHLTVSGAAKTRRMRLVEIPPNAVKWLEPFAKKKSPITPPNRQKDLAAIRKAAATLLEIERFPWTPDVLRHTAASMRLADTQDEAATAAWCGHGVDVLHRRYKALVPKTVAREFWRITPASVRRWSSQKET